MAQVIDTLVLELGLDPTKFTQGQREAMEALRKMQGQLEQGGKEAEAQGQKIESFFTGLKKQALGFGAALLGGAGAKEFVQYITTLDASVVRMSRTLNESTETISAWQGVARRTGGSAETMAGAMQGLSDQVEKFKLTGDAGNMLQTFNALNISLKDNSGNFKSVSQLFLDINRAIQGMDPARARVMMQALGIDPATTNTLLMNSRALEQMLATQKDISVTTRDQGENAEKLSRAWSEASQKAEDFGRRFWNAISPLATLALKGTSKLLGFLGGGDMLAGLTAANPDVRASGISTATPAAPAGAGRATNAEQEAYIRQAARLRGIDPEIAVAVARSEGMNNFTVGANQQSSVVTAKGREESYGPFQLYMGGGLGNKFQKQTGRDPRDSSTWKGQVDFSLDEAKKSGWGPWHGWRGLPRAGLDVGPNMAGEGGGGTTINNTTNIGDVVLNTKAENGTDAAKDFKAWMANQNKVSSANAGLR